MDPSKGKHPLFRSDHSYGNIVLNFQNAANNEFGVYAHAFHVAGQALFERMFNSGSYSDWEGCPIIFVYRQALELYLKAIVLHGETIVRFNAKGETLVKDRSLLKRHQLLPLLPLIEKNL